MKFKYIEKIDLTEDTLVEKTSFENEVGSHLLADLANNKSKLKGLRNIIVKKYSNNLRTLCAQLEDSPEKGDELFETIQSGGWQAHHINGIHKDNSIADIENLALVTNSIHKQLTNENKQIIVDETLKEISGLVNDTDVQKLVIRLFAVMTSKKVEYSVVFNSDVSKFNDELLKKLPLVLREHFYDKYSKSSNEVILLRDVVNMGTINSSK